MKINYDEKTVEDGGILYDMGDLVRLSAVCDRLCLMEYLLDNKDTYLEDWGIEIANAEDAYEMADEIREMVENTCDCEPYAINEYFEELSQR